MILLNSREVADEMLNTIIIELNTIILSKLASNFVLFVCEKFVSNPKVCQFYRHFLFFVFQKLIFLQVYFNSLAHL